MGPVLRDFEGDWRLDRRIDDRKAGQQARFIGEAVFRWKDGGFDYGETGQLSMPEVAPMLSSRQYRWEQDGAVIRVLFDDGRPFHAFDPAGGQAAADHWCDPDTYVVRYDFSAWPVWSCRWSVNGPRKDYVSETLFRRG